jgi:NAD(P)H-quinone oxidoreductase subunit N
MDKEFDLRMPLLLSGQKFRTDLESFGCLAILSPLEGGAETRLLRRLRAGGYQTQITSARGLGDPVVFLTQLHGIRPPHLGHQNVGRNGALGEVQQVIPQLNELLVEDKSLVLWLLEGQVLSKSELLAINNLCQKEPRIKIVIEMGGARSLKWQPLNEFINND